MLNKSFRQWLSEADRPIASEENTTELATDIFSIYGLKIGDEMITDHQAMNVFKKLTKGGESISDWLIELPEDDWTVLKGLILDALKEGNLNRLRQLGA